MKFKVHGPALAAGIDLVKLAIGKTQTLPVLATVKLKAEKHADGDRILLASTDLELALATTVAAQVEEEGELCLPGKRLGDIAGAVNGDEVAVRSPEATSLEFKVPAGRWRVQGLSADDFPAPAQVPVDGEGLVTAFSVKAESLSMAIHRVEYALSKDESRYNLTGVQMVLEAAAEGAQLTLHTTDGHRLVRMRLPIEEHLGGEKQWTAIIPGSGTAGLHALLKRGDMAVVQVAENTLFVTVGESRFSGRLIEGQFPNVAAVIEGPMAYKNVVEMDVKMLASAVARVTVVTEESTHPVIIEAKAGKMKLHAAGPETGDADYELPVAWPFEDIRIGVNSKYMLQYLRSVDGGKVSMSIGTGLTPILFSGEGVPLSIIMPMRV